jgi:hypothetical protein
MFRSTCSAILRSRLVCLHQFRAASNPTTSNSTTASESAPATSLPKKLPDPCSLMTQAEINVATQIQFETGESSKMPPEFLGAIGTPLNCLYKSGNQQMCLLVFQTPARNCF